jgi:hypothetical protein
MTTDTMPAREDLYKLVCQLACQLKSASAHEREVVRVHDTLCSVRRRYEVNEQEIRRVEAEHVEAARASDELTKTKANIDILVKTKGLLGPLHGAIAWLTTQYPSTNEMNIQQILMFIDAERDKLHALQMSLRAEIRKNSAQEAKYKALVRRREHLLARLAAKETEYEDIVSNNARLQHAVQSLVVSLDEFPLESIH